MRACVCLKRAWETPLWRHFSTKPTLPSTGRHIKTCSYSTWRRNLHFARDHYKDNSHGHSSSSLTSGFIEKDSFSQMPKSGYLSERKRVFLEMSFNALGFTLKKSIYNAFKMLICLCKKRLIAKVLKKIIVSEEKMYFLSFSALFLFLFFCCCFHLVSVEKSFWATDLIMVVYIVLSPTNTNPKQCELVHDRWNMHKIGYSKNYVLNVLKKYNGY